MRRRLVGLIVFTMIVACAGETVTTTTELVVETTTLLPTVDVAPTSTYDLQPGQAEYEEGFVYGYRNGFLAGGGLPQRQDDRDPSRPRDAGYVDGYFTGYDHGLNAHFSDAIYGVMKGANLADDQLFARILGSGDLTLAEPTWEEGRSRGTDIGGLYREEGLSPIPIPELITGQVQLSKAEFSTLSLYTIGNVLGYAESLSGFRLDGAQMPTTEYERGTQLGFAHGLIVALLGGDTKVGRQAASIDNSQLADPAGFEDGFVSGYDLGVSLILGS